MLQIDLPIASSTSLGAGLDAAGTFACVAHTSSFPTLVNDSGAATNLATLAPASTGCGQAVSALPLAMTATMSDHFGSMPFDVQIEGYKILALATARCGQGVSAPLFAAATTVSDRLDSKPTDVQSEGYKKTNQPWVSLFADNQNRSWK